MSSTIRRTVTRFDAAVDAGVEGLRGHPMADRVFYGASALGEHGLLWMGLAALRGLRGEHHRRVATRLFVGLAFESLIVNGVIKSVFRRKRPAAHEPRPLPLRIPITSSFPSGHASSSFFSAALLSDGDEALAPLYYAIAAIVAASRVYVKIHHASDVVAGVLAGAGLASVVRHVVPLEPAGR